VIFKSGNNLIPIEIKSSKIYNSEFLKSIQFFQKLTENRSPKGYVIYAGEKEQTVHSIELLNYNHSTNAMKL